MEKLNYQKTLVDGVQLGLKNVLNLLLMVVLYCVTFWIPYLNVGTTIGLYKAIIALSKGDEVNPLDIFDKENFKNIGDFFLLFGLQSLGIGVAAMFLFFPALVVSIAWNYAMYFFLDKGTSPLKSLSTSYEVTYGEKWTIFFVMLTAVVGVMVIAVLLALIPYVGGFLAAIATLCCLPIVLGLDATMYKHFAAKFDAKNAPVAEA